MSWLSRIFGRKPKQQTFDLRDQCGTWRAGDLALCIRDHDWDYPHPKDPIKGEVYRVAWVKDGESTLRPGLFAIWLTFPNCEPNASYRGDNFRKIVQQKDEATDGETVPDWLEKLREGVL